MKIKKMAYIGALLLASLSAVQAQTTLTAWTFDNDGTGASASPATSAGLGTASTIGLGTGSNPYIDNTFSGSSSTPALPDYWQLSGDMSGNIGWSTSSAIGSQGAQFSASTVGFYQVQVSFDVYATADAEASLQVQYTTEGTTWHNATITSAGTGGATINNNTITTNSLAVGSYVTLASGWNNQITINLSGISGIDNNPNFAIRIVNASTGTNCLTTTGAAYNNTSGTWALDNVVISGVSFDADVDWTFENLVGANTNVPVNNPIPAISNNLATATIMGFNLPTYVFANGVVGSTNYGDITANGAPYSSTGPAGQNVWRLRGPAKTTAGNGGGWTSAAGIGTQGAEFDVSTVNYTNVIVTFDLYMTSQGEAKMCVLYTTNGWATTNVANNLSYGANPSLIVTNDPASPFYSAHTVAGTYFFNDYGSIFFNNLVIDFTGDHTVENNPNFGIRIVNAATGFDCVNYLNQPYNNSSGNSRLDNVAVSGQYAGFYAPVVTNSAMATVDAPFTNTFDVNPAWSTNISAIYVNGVLVTNSAYTITPSNIVFNPGAIYTITGTNYPAAPILQVSGLDNIVIFATNYTSAKVNQFVATGVATKLNLTQLAGPSASGGTLTVNPVVSVTDQYGNGTTNPYSSLVVTASVSNSPAAGWTLGGSTVQQIVNGFCVFTDLTATVNGSTAVSNAIVKFSITGYTNALTVLYSTNFNIGAPPVAFTPGNLAAIQIDTLGNNTTFSVIELKPSAAGQTKPVNIVPISATAGTNSLRLSSAGSCGKLALSDDGTFLVFAAFQDGSSATADETFNLNRAVGTLNYTNLFASPVSYASISYGGSQARSACSPDNQNFLIDDKGGLYVNNQISYVANNVSVRSFGGTAFALTAKVAFPATPSLYEFANTESAPSIDYNNPGNDGPVIFEDGDGNPVANPPADSVAQDFYMISTNGIGASATYGILYVADQSGGAYGTNGIINKWILGSDNVTWNAAGSWTNIDNCDTLFATTNGSGGVYLYYANGGGGTAKNNIVRLTDQAASGSLNIISTNVIYTAPAGTSVEGITFVPQQIAYSNELTPPPILISATNTAKANNVFYITNTPDDATWRSSITSVNVNGSPLASSAIITNLTGKIGLIVQSAGIYSIVINATGYSADSISQVVTTGPATKLVIQTQPAAPATDGGVLATQPVILVEDANGALVSTNSTITATAVGAWTLGGTVAKPSVTGTATYTGLTAYSATGLGSATITFTSPGLTSVTSTAFTIPAPPVTAPTVISLTASNITASSATFDGSINPNGGTTYYWFQYGLDNTYGSYTATNTLSSGSSGVIVTNLVIGLSHGTNYHYTLVATNIGGTTSGLDSSFATLTVTAPASASIIITNGIGGSAHAGSAGGTFGFGFQGVAGATYNVLGTTNIALPLNQWSNLGQATENPAGSGNYQFTDPSATNAFEYYILQGQ